MNRTQRRQQERQEEKSKVTYTYNQQQFSAEVEKQMNQFRGQWRKEGASEAGTLIFAVFAVALHDELGFGKKRIGRIIKKAKNTINCLETNHVSIEDIWEECKRLKVYFNQI